MAQLIDRPIIIGGCPRSGTTLLRSCLNSHPNIFAGPECAYGLKSVEAVIETDKHIGGRAAHAFGLSEDDTLRSYGLGWEYWLFRILQTNAPRKGRVADKMPQYQRHFTMMSYMLPDALFVHVIRDPRDVACSLFDRTDMFGYTTGEPVEFCQYPDKAADYWRHETGLGLKMRSHENHSRYTEVHYEDLACNPEATLRRLLDFIGEDWDDAVMTPHDGGIEWTNGDTDQPPHAGSVGRWRYRLTERDALIVEQQASELMDRLGYPREMEKAVSA